MIKGTFLFLFQTYVSFSTRRTLYFTSLCVAFTKFVIVLGNQSLIIFPINAVKCVSIVHKFSISCWTNFIALLYYLVHCRHLICAGSVLSEACPFNPCLPMESFNLAWIILLSQGQTISCILLAFLQVSFLSQLHQIIFSPVCWYSFSPPNSSK